MSPDTHGGGPEEDTPHDGHAADAPHHGHAANARHDGHNADTHGGGLEADTPHHHGHAANARHDGHAADARRGGHNADAPHHGHTADTPHHGHTADAPHHGHTADARRRGTGEGPPLDRPGEDAPSARPRRRAGRPAGRGLTAVLATGLAAALLAGAAGCSLPKTHHRPGTSHEEATGSVAPATEPPAGEDEDGASSGRVIEIAVAGHRVSPSPGRIRLHRGRRVTLRVTSDRDDELHVHGYDKEAELPAGTPVTLTFTADRTGLFEVETHKSHLVLTQLLVR